MELLSQARALLVKWLDDKEAQTRESGLTIVAEARTKDPTAFLCLSKSEKPEDYEVFTADHIGAAFNLTSHKTKVAVASRPSIIDAELIEILDADFISSESRRDSGR
jgi:hypothetical protein